MKRGNRPGARPALALTVILGLMLAGCASRNASLPPPNAKPPVQPATARRAPAYRPAQAPSATADAADEATIEKDYIPHVWPDPETDLWSNIRNGFELDGNTQRPAVRQWTQFYATHRGHLDASLKRARPFLWHIVHQVEARDMPTEIALLPLVESGYNASARSYVGASGLWQFMPGTADHMGLSRDWWYDGRNDVIASTDAALDYLELLCHRYDGDWLLALAAYNAGPGRVDAALARARAEGASTSYWDLELPMETTQYVPKLLAVRRIMMTPARFGVDWPALDNVPRTRTVQLPDQVEMAVAARMMDIPEGRLRRLNPGMRRWASSPEATHTLLVPADKARQFKRKLAATAPGALVRQRRHTVRRGEVLGRIAKRYGVSITALRQANHLRGDRILTGEKLEIPRSGTPGSPPPPAAPTQRYVVQSGDTLWDIAHRYNTGLASLEHANRGIAGRALHPGQSLLIPGSATPPEPSTYVVKNGDSLWSIARHNDVTVADLRRWNRLGDDNALQPGRSLAIDGPAPLPDYYEVEAGDSLWSIANRFSMQVNTLRSLNDMSASSTIRPGQRLRLQPSVSS